MSWSCLILHAPVGKPAADPSSAFQQLGSPSQRNCAVACSAHERLSVAGERQPAAAAAPSSPFEQTGERQPATAAAAAPGARCALLPAWLCSPWSPTALRGWMCWQVGLGSCSHCDWTSLRMRGGVGLRPLGTAGACVMCWQQQHRP